MSEIKSREPDFRPNGANASPLKVGLLFALICVALYLAYTTWKGDDVTSSIPRAMQVTYVPADFKMNLDEQKTLDILSNPQRYRQEFDDLILNFNTNLVVHVSNRMGLSAPYRTAAVNEYRKMHPYIRQMYFNDIIGLSDTTSQLYRTWYENEGATAADLLNEVASKYTCFFITNIMTTVLKTQDGKLAVKGSKIETPCGIALTEGLRPIVKRLQDAAAIRDFSRAKGLMQERVERAITELAVMEVRDKKGIKYDNNTKVWGYSVSNTSLEITAISIAKIGFNLNQFMNISVDDRNKTVVVTLPQPQILSHEVFPKVENLDVGWMREISSQDFNDAVNKLRQSFREDVYNTDMLNKAKQRAGNVMDMMLSPMVRNINKGYKVSVKFQSEQNLEYNMPQQQQQQLPQRVQQVQQPLRK
jgi:hypothetical protein